MNKVEQGFHESLLHQQSMSDREFMGTRDQAEAELLAKWAEWCKYQQPVMGAAKQLRQHDAERREATVRFVGAAASLAWHLANPLPSTPSR